MCNQCNKPSTAAGGLLLYIRERKSRHAHEYAIKITKQEGTFGQKPMTKTKHEVINISVCEKQLEGRCYQFKQTSCKICLYTLFYKFPYKTICSKY